MAVFHSQLTRAKSKEIAKEYNPQTEPSTVDRRMRELCAEWPIKPVDKKGKEVTTSKLIYKWVWYSK